MPDPLLELVDDPVKKLKLLVDRARLDARPGEDPIDHLGHEGILALVAQLSHRISTSTRSQKAIIHQNARQNPSLRSPSDSSR